MNDLQTRLIELDGDIDIVNEYLRSQLSKHARKGLKRLRSILEREYNIIVAKIDKLA